MILVTGCPRSGTGYAAMFLRKQGLHVGHEYLDRDGTVSWQFAADDESYPWHPDGERRRDYVCDPVLHQVRDPLRVIASLEVLKAPDWAFAARHVGELPDGDMERRVAFYVRWNRLCAHQADYRYKVEAMAADWPTIHAFVGGRRELHGATVRLTTLVNARPHGDVTWAAIRATSHGCEAEDMAREYGYPVACGK